MSERLLVKRRRYRSTLMLMGVKVKEISGSERRDGKELSGLRG